LAYLHFRFAVIVFPDEPDHIRYPVSFVFMYFAANFLPCLYLLAWRPDQRWNGVYQHIKQHFYWFNWW